MASPFSYYALAPPPTTHPSYPINITQDEIKLFHKIERALFCRLVFNFGCNSSKSIPVMALFLWLERTGENFRLVPKLLNWPDSCLQALVEEAIMALDCLEGSLIPPSLNHNNLPIMQTITNSEISLHFFHEKSLGIKGEIAKITNDVCLIAFSNILRNEQSMNPMLNPRMFQNLKAIPTRPTLQEAMFYNPSFGDFVPQQPTWAPELLGTQMDEQSLSVDFTRHNFHHRNDSLEYEISEILSKLELGVGEVRDVLSVPPEDRTIFMTFSKEYPISRYEIQDFFKRTFGDILEGIYMQRVEHPSQQPLHARLVVRSPEKLQLVLGFHTGRVKFTINGKHAWARKYYPSP